VAEFAGFAAGRLVMFQQLEFGPAIAVLLDATIVRSVLVPSSMNCWAIGTGTSRPCSSGYRTSASKVTSTMSCPKRDRSRRRPPDSGGTGPWR
jgi:hypothetical protein